MTEALTCKPTLKDADKDSWTSRKGPQPGVRYRSGQPPQPPPWRYNTHDVRAFSKWKRKVEIWERQVSAYLPKNEAALLLYTSLTGEAEDEIEYMDMAQVDSKDGISHIMSVLEGALQQKITIFLKRRYLDDFEHLQRYANETLRAFANRYQRCETALQSVGISVGSMYDSEARGSRLLDRARVSREHPRMILVAAHHSLDFQSIKDAMMLMFPDHRGAPQLYGRDGNVLKGGGKGGKGSEHPGGKGAGKSKGSHHSSSSSSSNAAPRERRVYITDEAPEVQADDEILASDAGEPDDEDADEAGLPDIPEGDEDADEQEIDPAR